MNYSPKYNIGDIIGGICDDRQWLIKDIKDGCYIVAFRHKGDRKWQMNKDPKALDELVGCKGTDKSTKLVKRYKSIHSMKRYYEKL